MQRASRIFPKHNVAGKSMIAGIAVLMALGVGVTGCTLNRKAQRDLTSALQDYARRRNTQAGAYARGGNAAAAGPARSTATTQPAAAAGQPRTLEDYIRLALEQNPEIRAAEQAARALAERVPQVTALRDPVLKMKVMPEPVRTAEGDNYFVLGIQQKLPIPQKLTRRGAAALAQMRAALEQYRAVRLRVIADVKRAYYRLYVVDRTIEIETANRDLLRGLIDAVQAQVAVGGRSQADLLRAQVEFSTLESRLIELRRRRGVSVAMLNRLLDRAPRAPVGPTPEVEPEHVELEVRRLLGVAEAHNPELKRLAREIESRRASLELAKLGSWPDFTLGLEWIQVDPRDAFQPPPNPQTGIRPPAPKLSEEGSDNWAITLSMNLPIWQQRIRAAIREAQSRLRAAQHDLGAAKNRVQFQVQDALLRVYEQQELADLFAHTIIPQARQTYEVSRAAYTAGRGDFLTVIDNWQKWLAFSIQYRRAIGETERAVADLEQALGISLVEAKK